jgi:copper resistance protein C
MSRLPPSLLTLLLLVASALGHSEFEGSSPKDGETMKASPREVRIWFSEPIKVALSTVAVSDASGKQVDQRDLHADEKQPSLVRLSLPANLAPGLYKVTWTAVAQDLHVGKGGFRFHVAP